MGRIRGAGSNTYLEYTEEGEPLEWIMEYANFEDSNGRISGISRQKVVFMVRSFFLNWRKNSVPNFSCALTLC